MVLALLEMGPGCPTVPIMEDKASASVAADSMAPKTSGLTSSLVLPRAERSKGWVSRGMTGRLGTSTCGGPVPEPRLGEADTVVAFVVAVRGRSSDDLDMAPPDVDGILPVRSRRWILDFKSSNSSQTVDGAAVEDEDSVPSTPWFASEVWGASAWTLADFGTSGEEWYVRDCARAKFGLLYCGVALEPERLLFSVSDCLLRWYAELLSAKESLNEICLGVTGGGLGGVRPCCGGC